MLLEMEDFLLENRFCPEFTRIMSPREKNLAGKKAQQFESMDGRSYF